MKRIGMLLGAAVLGVVVGSAAPAVAQVFPGKPVRLVVPASAGGLTDTLARATGQRLAALWGQPVVVENRPGANQIIGAEFVAKSPPDGYTLLVTDSSTLVINPHLYRSLPYDPVRDFTPITVIGSNSPVIAVHPSVSATNMAELMAATKARPDHIRYGSMGQGSYAHIATEQLKRMGGVDMLHVPYKGSAPALADLLSGQISLMLVNINIVEPHMRSGRLRVIAAATPKRLAQHPAIPTVSESGLPGFEASSWWAVVGPARLGEAVLARLHADLARVLTDADFRAQFLTANGMEPTVNTPAEFRVMLQSELARWQGLVRASGAKLD